MAKFMKIVLIISLSGVIYAAPHAQDTISLSREKRSDCKHPRVSICEVCSGSGKLIRCLNKQNFGEYCYRQYDYTRTGGWKTTMGVTDDATCRANALKSRLANPNCDLDVPPDGTSCYDCCITFLCQELHSDRCNAIYPTNSSTMPDFMQQAVTTRKTHTLRPTTLKPTTPIPTTTTTTPIPTTTTAATTTPKPTTTMTTTTTIKTTTTTKITSTQAQTTTSLETKGTTSKHGGLCQVCSDDGTCSGSHYVYCPENRPYCMNDLIYDKAGRRQTVKRCVSEIYCYWDWWIGTQQNDPKCNASLSPNVTDDVCHYCCQTGHGDSLPCNVDAIPKQTESFKKPKKGKLCEVTDLMTNSVQTKECPDSEPFCMNDVFYDKSSASADHVIEVNKKCVSESICKGDWWIKSKARAECLSGDIASVAEGNLLCHYCCLSDDTGPCNNATRPQQIYDFLTKTSIIPSSTGATDIHQCDKFSIVTALSHNYIVTNNGTNCPDGKHEYSDALVTKYCNGTAWKNWKRGLKVIDNCSKLNRFTPIAAFAGTYFSHDGLAGALLSCNSTDIRVVAQSCTYSTKVVHVYKNTRDSYIHNVDNYYTINW